MDQINGQITPHDDDRRLALRQRCRVATLVVEHASVGIFTATVLDISRQGFRLLMPVSVPCGDEILIHPPAGSDLLKIRATIVRQYIMTYESSKMIACGVEVADTAAWRRHNWFLTLRVTSREDDSEKPSNALAVAA